MRRIHTTKPGHASLQSTVPPRQLELGSAGSDRLMLWGWQSRAAGMRVAQKARTRKAVAAAHAAGGDAAASPAIGGMLSVWRGVWIWALQALATRALVQLLSVEVAGRAAAEAAWRLEVEAELMVLRDELEVMRLKMAEMLG